MIGLGEELDCEQLKGQLVCTYIFRCTVSPLEINVLALFM